MERQVECLWTLLTSRQQSWKQETRSVERSLAVMGDNAGCIALSAAKLRGYGIEGRILTWIEAFLTDRRQRVVVNDSRSSWADVTSGIPQGSLLGPMLFIIYINDMPTSVLSSIYLFADDAKVYRNISSNDDPPTLQHDLQQLEKWSERWQLRFNSNKCKVMHLGRQNPRQNYTMGGTTLATTTSEKDLGVYVDTELTF